MSGKKRCLVSVNEPPMKKARVNESHVCPCPNEDCDGFKRCSGCDNKKHAHIKFFNKTKNRWMKTCVHSSTYKLKMRKLKLKKRLEEEQKTGLKSCTSCIQFSELSQFLKPNGTLFLTCLACRDKSKKKKRLARQRAKKEEQKTGKKSCSKCNNVKELSEFLKANGNNFARCLSCRARARQYQQSKSEEAKKKENRTGLKRCTSCNKCLEKRAFIGRQGRELSTCDRCLILRSKQNLHLFASAGENERPCMHCRQSLPFAHFQKCLRGKRKGKLRFFCNTCSKKTYIRIKDSENLMHFITQATTRSSAKK